MDDPRDDRFLGGYEAELSRIAEAAMGGVTGYKLELGDVLGHEEAIAIVRKLVEGEEGL